MTGGGNGGGRAGGGSNGGGDRGGGGDGGGGSGGGGDGGEVGVAVQAKVVAATVEAEEAGREAAVAA
eukprot:7376872-Prymnesium_polylepis.1